MLRAVARVLDTGCGSVRNLVYFLREGYEVFGVDTDPNAIECTRSILRTDCSSDCTTGPLARAVSLTHEGTRES